MCDDILCKMQKLKTGYNNLQNPTTLKALNYGKWN